jgi:predicted ATP-binding protein involved in virulence
MRDFRIHQVIVNHLGVFEHLNLQLKEKVDAKKADIHILTGENGTGKSTILQVISSLITPHQLTPKAHLDFKDQVYTDIRFSSFQENTQVAEGEILTFEAYKNKFNNGQWQAERTNRNDQFLKYIQKWRSYQFEKFDFAIFAYSGYRRLDQANISYIQELSENPLERSLDLSNSINPQIILQWVANTKTKEALAYTKGDLPKAEQYKSAIKRIERVVSDITGLQLEFVLSDSPLQVQINIDGVKLDFSLLADGIKSIISWIADMLMRMDRLTWNTDVEVFDRNFILLLDEVEVHLHPAWQRKVLPIIQDLFRNAQIIVSTHSPFVTNSVDNAWIYKLKKAGHFSVLDGEPILSENAKSYRTILEEIFGVSRQFGDEVEKELDLFYSMKNEILTQRRPSNDSEFLHLTNSLRRQSIELESIIGMELKQMNKLSKAEG